MRSKVALSVALLLLCSNCFAFALTLLEAEQAKVVSGQVSVLRHANASGGAFVEAQTTSTVRFTIKSPKPMSVRVIPIFWRNSVRTQPRFFPYPLPTLPGPDAIAVLGGQIYFTAPASGQIGIVDAEKGQLVGTIKVGGYLTDLLADEKRQRLLVADAWNGRLIAIDPTSHRVVTQTLIPQIWSLALNDHEDLVLAVSRSGRKLVVLDAKTLKPLRNIALPTQPLQVSSVTPSTYAVYFEPFVLRLSDFAFQSPDRPDYGFGRRTTAEFGPRNQVGWKRFSLTKEGVQIIVRTEKGDERRLIPIAAPVSLSLVGDRLLVGTAKGMLAVIDIAAEKSVTSLQISDRPVDVIAVGGKGYTTDATQNRVLVVDVGKGSVVKSIAVPEEPVALDAYEPRWWTQDAAPRPLLFVACRKAKAVSVIDIGKEQVERTVQLPFAPASVRVVIPPDPGWWPNIPADRIAFEMTPRLAILPEPFHLGDSHSPSEPSILGFQRRGTATIKLPNGDQMTVSADNNHTIRFVVQREGKTLREQWLDTSEITDAAGTAPVVEFGALKIADQPWNRSIWMTPDQHLFLIADTDEFWRWNAPVISLKAGINSIPVTLQRFVQLDDLRLEQVPPIDIQVMGEPTVEIPERYRAVFYADEPVRLRVNVRSQGSGLLPVRLVTRIYNYMGEEVWVRVFEGTGQRVLLLEPKLRETGIFRLEVKAETPDGTAQRSFYFLRLPKLERPRLLARRTQLDFAKAQISRYPNLFSRYFDWLKESLSEPGMLPVSLVSSEFGAALPPEQQKLSSGGVWRRYDFGWRLIALQFAATMLPEPEKQQLRRQVLQVLKSGRTDGYCHFHHHGPFFPGFVAAFLDLVAADIGENAEEVKRLREFLATRLGDMNVFAWTLAALNDPPSERERILLWHLMTWTVNVERYFALHAGKRGGTWWLNQRTGCHCPFGAYAFAFLYLRHFLGEERFHYRTFVRGFLTHARLSRPLNDALGLFGPPGPPGEPQRWITFALSRHPLTETIYGWQNLVQRLEGEPLNRNDLAKILTFPTGAAHNIPVPFVLPIGLAMGWYDPNAPKVSWDELPTTLFFDGEGEVVMRSDYGLQATEVFFACGIRDHVYRHQPTNLIVLKAGQPLLGTASLWGDHGCPSLQISRGNSWGNVVVIEPSDWQTRWKHNFFHPRGEELALINRFSDATFRMLTREQRLTGYTPAEGGYGGGLDLHGHTQTFLHREGHIIAFETHPKFDYVAGDGTLSWLPEQARLVLRQLVFVKPDLLIVYDRVRLGEKAQHAYWLAATGLEPRTQRNHFVVRSGNAFLNGFVAFPTRPRLIAIAPADSPKYAPLFDKQALDLKVLEIHGEKSEKGKVVEFFVVMRAGLEKLPLMTVTPQVTAKQISVIVQANGSKIKVAFNRSDICSGTLTIDSENYALQERVKDTYDNWRNDPRYTLWRTDMRFDFLAVR